ncbi:hypothetical protein BS47DRAFT_80529 [Hydnum rufescens UP504]|uniref:Uncharacterized protein n=1 Tax=Hydnum rufescens UP504 TaxID=1448309 RepID=A0A9P6E1G2_9AGAM|nr:hypothetical protein BS47DRAFT_80529 [Hydnum rufescens UP504]
MTKDVSVIAGLYFINEPTAAICTRPKSICSHWCVRSLGRNTGIYIPQDRMALQRIREAAEEAKSESELSLTAQTDINLLLSMLLHCKPRSLVSPSLSVLPSWTCERNPSFGRSIRCGLFRHGTCALPSHVWELVTPATIVQLKTQWQKDAKQPRRSQAHSP